MNLASRLEGLCKPLGVEAVFSETVAAHTTELTAAGSHSVKGVADPVQTYVLTDGSSTSRTRHSE